MADAADSGHNLGDSIDAGRGELLTVLLRHEVKFVVIGGAAIQSHGRRYVTEDIHLTPDTEEANLQRLADALNELECRLVTDPADPSSWVALPADYFTPRSLLAASVWNLATRHGVLDLSFTPSGFPGGYADLAPHATTMPAAGTSISVLVASLDDVHASKRAANRPKDRAYFAASGEPTRLPAAKLGQPLALAGYVTCRGDEEVCAGHGIGNVKVTHSLEFIVSRRPQSASSDRSAVASPHRLGGPLLARGGGSSRRRDGLRATASGR